MKGWQFFVVDTSKLSLIHQCLRCNTWYRIIRSNVSCVTIIWFKQGFLVIIVYKFSSCSLGSNLINETTKYKIMW